MVWFFTKFPARSRTVAVTVLCSVTPMLSGPAWSSSVAGTVATNSTSSCVVVPSVLVAVMTAGPALDALILTVALPATALMEFGTGCAASRGEIHR